MEQEYFKYKLNGRIKDQLDAIAKNKELSFRNHFGSIAYESYRRLADMAELEDWTLPVQRSENGEQAPHEFGLLTSYIWYTVRRSVDEGKISSRLLNETDTIEQWCFDTGLQTRNYHEPIYGIFETNTNCENNDNQPWHCKGFFAANRTELIGLYPLPQKATYWENGEQSRLIMDPSKEIIPNWPHLFDEKHLARFPKKVAELNDYQRRCLVMGAIDASCKRVERNYKVAIPSYFFTEKKLQLLLPLCLETTNVADLALVLDLDDGENCYRAVTCLELGQAVQNARLIASPDRNWLNGESVEVPDSRGGDSTKLSERGLGLSGSDSAEQSR